MILAQRRRHLRVWSALAILVPLGLLAAILARPADPPAPASPVEPGGVSP